MIFYIISYKNTFNSIGDELLRLCNSFDESLNGILVKKSEILENVNKVDIIVFDKTGTLTYGNLRISKIIFFIGCSLQKHVSKNKVICALSGIIITMKPK